MDVSVFKGASTTTKIAGSPIHRLPLNIYVKILTYLRNKEILYVKLVSKRFYSILSSPFNLRLCLETELPKQASESIRACISLCTAKKSPLTSEQLQDQLCQHMSQINLLSLNLSGLGIHTEEIIRLLCKALEKQPHYIEKIWLNDNNLAKDAISPLVTYLEKAKEIKEINLKDTKLSKGSIEKLCSALMENKGVQTLNLSDNMIGVTGAKHIAEMLKRNRTLEKLYLQRTYLGKEGVGLIVEALQSNTTLRRLHLEENKVSFKSVKSSVSRLTKIYI